MNRFYLSMTDAQRLVDLLNRERDSWPSQENMLSATNDLRDAIREIWTAKGQPAPRGELLFYVDYTNEKSPLFYIEEQSPYPDQRATLTVGPPTLHLCEEHARNPVLNAIERHRAERDAQGPTEQDRHEAMINDMVATRTTLDHMLNNMTESSHGLFR